MFSEGPKGNIGKKGFSIKEVYTMVQRAKGLVRQKKWNGIVLQSWKKYIRQI